jgi:hypothetical protein
MLRNIALLVGLASFSFAGATAHAKPTATQQATKAARVDPKTFDEVRSAIYHHAGKTGGVLDFMTTMSKQGYVQTDKGKVTLAQFKQVWTNKNDSKWVEGKFRDADNGMHEWIPSNYIPKVIDRAHTSKEGVAWVQLQNKMRSPTNLILFKPSKWDVVDKGGKTLIPQGHSGAAFDKKTGFELTEHQAEFHDELRKVFDQSKTIDATVAGMKEVVSKWVWDGEKLQYPIAKNVVTHDGKPLGPNAHAQQVQRTSYKEIMDMLDGIQKVVADAVKPKV